MNRHQRKVRYKDVGLTSMAPMERIPSNEEVFTWMLFGDGEASSSNLEDETSVERERRIRFDAKISIREIPSHSDYCESEKKRIWSTSEETSQNASRNRREFSFEGWDPRRVLEEHEMFHDRRSNERIHPVHLGGILSDR